MTIEEKMEVCEWFLRNLIEYIDNDEMTNRYFLFEQLEFPLGANSVFGSLLCELQSKVKTNGSSRCVDPCDPLQTVYADDTEVQVHAESLRSILNALDDDTRHHLDLEFCSLRDALLGAKVKYEA